MKKVSAGVTAALVALSAAVAVTATYELAIRQFNDKLTDFNQRQAMYAKLSEVDTKVRQDYYGALDEDALEESLCGGYLAGLQDDNAEYFTEDAYKAYVAAQSTTKVGAGVWLQDTAAGVTVTRVYDQSAAQTADIQVGDLLMQVNGQAVLSADAGDGLLCGSSGQAAQLLLQRSGQEVSVQLNYTKYEALTVRYEVFENVGYLRIDGFLDKTGQEVSDALDYFYSVGIHALILDLRGCSAGTAENMEQTADLLLAYGDTARYMDRTGQIVSLCTSGIKAVEYDVQVLADSGTRGTAEILCAAIQDFGKGQVVGACTFGAAPYIKVTQLSDGSALGITNGYFLRADGSQISGSGVLPEVECALDGEQSLAHSAGLLSLQDDPVFLAALQLTQK